MLHSTNRDLHPIILDCNLWIELITRKSSPLRDKLFSENHSIIVTSYMIVEILRALKRLSSKIKTPYITLERAFWEFINRPNVKKIFQQSISDSLIKEIKELPEIKIIASLLDLERKDVPYISAAFQFNVILLTADIRSLIALRTYIKEKLKVNILLKEEFLKNSKISS